MSVVLSLAEKINRATTLNNDIGGSATIKIYTGGIPSLIGGDLGIESGILLATFTCQAGTFGSVVSNAGVVSLIAGAIAQVSAIATGTAGTARLSTLANVPIMDLDVTATGGGGALQLNTTAIVSGGPLIISSYVISEG